MFQKILGEARDRLSEIQQDKARYKELLSGLIAQGLFQILEDEVIITCLPDEVDLIRVRMLMFYKLFALLYFCDSVLL